MVRGRSLYETRGELVVDSSTVGVQLRRDEGLYSSIGLEKYRWRVKLINQSSYVQKGRDLTMTVT